MVTVDRDILVLANPEIAGLSNWVVALVAAGALAARCPPPPPAAGHFVRPFRTTC